MSHGRFRCELHHPSSRGKGIDHPFVLVDSRALDNQETWEIDALIGPRERRSHHELAGEAHCFLSFSTRALRARVPFEALRVPGGGEAGVQTEEDKPEFEEGLLQICFWLIRSSASGSSAYSSLQQDDEVCYYRPFQRFITAWPILKP